MRKTIKVEFKDRKEGRFGSSAHMRHMKGSNCRYLLGWDEYRTAGSSTEITLAFYRGSCWKENTQKCNIYSDWMAGLWLNFSHILVNFLCYYYITSKIKN